MNLEYKTPYLLDFDQIGTPGIGYISVLEGCPQIPFEIRRVFWTYDTPDCILRGRHAHYHTEQIIVAVSGRIIVTTEMPDGTVNTFVMDTPSKGLYLPPQAWHTLQYSQGAVQMVVASTLYQEEDYIRDYATFKRVYAHAKAY